MHKSDIDKLEHILTHPEVYKKELKLREFELEDTVKETIPQSKQNNDLQDPRTIRASSNTSTVENKAIKLHSDVKYQLLYSIVHNTPKFVRTCNDLEQTIIDYRYRQVDISMREWEQIACVLDEKVQADSSRYQKKSIGKTTTLIIRDKMLERLAEYIGYPLI